MQMMMGGDLGYASNTQTAMYGASPPLTTQTDTGNKICTEIDLAIPQVSGAHGYSDGAATCDDLNTAMDLVF